jgi:putative ABC transport system substrate-binding protein
MRRREFLIALGGVAASWPLVARAQQTMPVVGFLRSSPAAPFAHIVKAFLDGLGETGYVDGHNVKIEQRWANNHADRLPALAAELVRARASVIVGNSLAIDAARNATATTPLVFIVGDDPVKMGYVQSLNRPGGNITGVTFFGGGKLGAKRLELLHELVPKASVIAVLLDPEYVGFEVEMPSVKAAARALGMQIVLVKPTSERDIEAEFARFVKEGVGALLLGGGPALMSRHNQLVALAARYRIPAIYEQTAYVSAGGLISYSASFSDAYRQAGVYAGRILKGAKPAELPVLLPTRFDLAINLKTAKALGITVPPALLVRADKVIE